MSALRSDRSNDRVGGISHAMRRPTPHPLHSSLREIWVSWTHRAQIWVAWLFGQYFEKVNHFRMFLRCLGRLGSLGGFPGPSRARDIWGFGGSVFSRASWGKPPNLPNLPKSTLLIHIYQGLTAHQLPYPILPTLTQSTQFYSSNTK